MPVIELDELKDKILPQNRERLHILICTPEDIHEEIAECLRKNGFLNYTCMNSCKETKLMEQYFIKIHEFQSIHQMLVEENKEKKLKNK